MLNINFINLGRDNPKLSALILIRKTLDDYMYYIDDGAVTCRNISINASADSPGHIYYDDLLVSTLSTSADVESNGIVFRSNEDKVEMFNEDYFYKKVTYLPSHYGKFTIKYALKVKVTEFYYLSSTICLIQTTNTCYESCGTCTYIGSEDNHQCDTCKNKYYKVENTNNCYRSPPNNYYLDERDSLIKHCMNNCFICSDRDTCSKKNCRLFLGNHAGEVDVFVTTMYPPTLVNTVVTSSEGAITDIIIDYKNCHIFTASTSGVICVLDLSVPGKEKHIKEISSFEGEESLKSIDNKIILSGGADSTLKSFKLPEKWISDEVKRFEEMEIKNMSDTMAMLKLQKSIEKDKDYNSDEDSINGWDYLPDLDNY